MMRASTSSDAIAEASATSALVRLTATSRSSVDCRARITWPMPPSPRTRTGWKSFDRSAVATLGDEEAPAPAPPDCPVDVALPNVRSSRRIGKLPSDFPCSAESGSPIRSEARTAASSDDTVAATDSPIRSPRIV